MDLKKRLDQLLIRIEKVSPPNHAVQLIAVSKYATIEQIKALHACGQCAFGENKIQDYQIKSNALQDLALEWHMLGVLQHNKINKLLALKPALLHSLHSLELAKAIQTRTKEPLNALLQVNIAQESSKSGISPDLALQTYLSISQTCPQVHLKGLMVIGPLNATRVQTESVFKKAKELFDQLPHAQILSMGMSADFEIAIACGSNMVRIGNALFKN
ncbi:YggS family pyridoxal phosphate-dependent enzyme [Helicobacter suis]|uniref:YggS family pyridoxal phosphate-dependent enzyme n=1 Tax=Helicobacter suis TaxID=104628 RepID=UPI001F076D92|nr:YggS family pyridoxal phosphate-dependent enzyme [Helicobacter suis]